MKKLVLILAAGIAALFFLFSVFKKPISGAMFNRAVEAQVGQNVVASLPDGLHIFLCGAGSPLPDPTRSEPCMGVIAGNEVFLVDVGSGGMRNLGSMGFPFGDIKRIYLTHLHSDHINGLGEALLLNWVGGTGRQNPLPIIGPAGTAEVVAGINMTYRIDSTYRIDHHGEKIAKPAGYGGSAIEFGVNGEEKVSLVESDHLKINAIKVSHSPVEPAYGYRIDYKGRSVMISGDTVYSEKLVNAAQGVDVLFHEALQPKMVEAMRDALAQSGQVNTSIILADILDYHTSPEDAAKAAANANAQELVLYHIVPPLPVKLLETTFLGEASTFFDGKITVGADGMIFSLPSGSEKIIHRYDKL